MKQCRMSGNFLTKRPISYTASNISMDFNCEKFSVAPYPTLGPSTCQIQCHIKNRVNLGERLLNFSFPNT